MSTNPNQIVKPNLFLKISSPEKRGPSILLVKFEIRAICFKDISKYSIILIFCLWKRSQRNGPYVSCCVNTLEWLIWWLTKYCPRSPTVGQHEKEMLEMLNILIHLFLHICPNQFPHRIWNISVLLNRPICQTNRWRGWEQNIPILVKFVHGHSSLFLDITSNILLVYVSHQINNENFWPCDSNISQIHPSESTVCLWKDLSASTKS